MRVGGWSVAYMPPAFAEERYSRLEANMATDKQHTEDSATLTPLYARWMDDLLGAAIPRETKATCDDCCMCARPGDEADNDRFFDPSIKCCSIVPELSNFLVGGILSAPDLDEDSRFGRESILRRISEGIEVTPVGLGQSPLFRLVYENQDAFGRSSSLRCPHYVQSTGRCGIRQHRNAVCIVWYCKHVRGAVSNAFWRDSLENLLELVERNLAAWCITQMDVGIEALRELYRTGDVRPALLTAAQLDKRPDLARHRRVWGSWLGREQEFFIECARLVDSLSWDQVVEICGSQARIQADLTRHAFAQLVSEEIPASLKAGSFQLIQITNGISRVKTYSEMDPLDVPDAVMETLGYFDGRPTEEAIQAILKDKAIQLTPDLIRKFCDFQLLVPASNPNSVE